MKEVLFRNKETGKLKAAYCDEGVSNIEASRQFKELHGKQWGLVMSRQWNHQKTEGGNYHESIHQSRL